MALAARRRSIQSLKYGMARASRPLANKNREAVLPFSSSLINPAYQLGTTMCKMRQRSIHLKDEAETLKKAEDL
jgi:hypothetical protein